MDDLSIRARNTEIVSQSDFTPNSKKAQSGLFGMLAFEELVQSTTLRLEKEAHNRSDMSSVALNSDTLNPAARENDIDDGGSRRRDDDRARNDSDDFDRGDRRPDAQRVDRPDDRPREREAPRRVEGGETRSGDGVGDRPSDDSASQAANAKDDGSGSDGTGEGNPQGTGEDSGAGDGTGQETAVAASLGAVRTVARGSAFADTQAADAAASGGTAVGEIDADGAAAAKANAGRDGKNTHGQNAAGDGDAKAKAQAPTQAQQAPAGNAAARQAAELGKAIGSDQPTKVNVTVTSEAETLVSRPASTLTAEAALDTGDSKAQQAQANPRVGPGAQGPSLH